MARAVCIFCVIWLQTAVAITPAVPESPTGKRSAPTGTVTATPSFGTSMDCPAFLVSFTNTSSRPTDALSVAMSEAVKLDGRIYPRIGLKWAGRSAALRSGETWSHTVELSEFLLGIKRQQYSAVLRRWRWKVPLKSGKHVLTFFVGKSRSDQMAFTWDGDGPMLYR